MNLHIKKTPALLGEKAAALTASLLRQAIAENGRARLVLSTGSSQFETLEALVKGDFAGLVGQTSTKGADTATPPANTGGGTLTKADIYKKDDKGRYLMSASERQKALMENQIM